eukprot:c21143_g1_i3.p1 GENE.c21143_g1_i3~~c21143_g1_i3.p1  ORF type:complete len:666 (+),score=254.75 c21143_g1_i3:167-2164(+)
MEEPKIIEPSEKKKKKRVRFDPNYDEVPPLNYELLPESKVDIEVPISGIAPTLPPTSIKRTTSSIKKQKFNCKNSREIKGYLCINGGRVIFNSDGAEREHHWDTDLSQVAFLEVENINLEQQEYTLLFILEDKSFHYFTNLEISSKAYQMLVNDAELLGFVIALDQPLLNPLIETNKITSIPLKLESDLAEENSNKLKGTSIFQNLVSGSVNRFINAQYNLNLTYITRKVIVMAFPGSTGSEVRKYNSANEIKNFLDQNHPHSFMIFNLNSDDKYKYDANKFYGRVRNFGFPSQSPPTLNAMMQTCHDIAAYVRQSPKNIVVVHCIAGKGRSGTIICAWLLHSRVFHKAEDAISYFSKLRMKTGEDAIKNPSQKRYVKYMERITFQGMPPARMLKLQGAKLSPCPPCKSKLTINVIVGENKYNIDVKPREGSLLINIDDIVLKGDIKIVFTVDENVEVFRLFFNSRMIEKPVEIFTKNDIDGENRIPGFKILPSNFIMTLVFEILIIEKPTQKRTSFAERRASGRLSSQSLNSIPVRSKEVQKKKLNDPNEINEQSSSSQSPILTQKRSPLLPVRSPHSLSPISGPITPLTPMTLQSSTTGLTQPAPTMSQLRNNSHHGHSKSGVPTLQRKSTGWISRSRNGDDNDINNNNDESKIKNSDNGEQD